MGQRIQRLRKAAGLSQSELARASGIPLGTIQGWEHNRREPLLSAAAKIALALGISLDELAGIRRKKSR
jgi:transcriptional regulator with XRE-family HTH domain